MYGQKDLVLNRKYEIEFKCCWEIIIILKFESLDSLKVCIYDPKKRRIIPSVTSSRLKVS